MTPIRRGIVFALGLIVQAAMSDKTFNRSWFTGHHRAATILT
jgi:hypothetical protein